jgi:hypothetical protein
VLLPQRTLTLSSISGGRFILGLGMTHRVVTEVMGVSRGIAINQQWSDPCPAKYLAAEGQPAQR